MPDERCPAVHPKLGLQCDRKVWDCWGIDHICARENGLGEFWRNELGSSPMHQYFEDWMVAKQNVTEEAEKEAMPTMNENTDTQSQQLHAGPPCPACSAPLDPQCREPLIYWCAVCREWFDGELKVCLWEAGLTLDFHESSPLPKGTPQNLSLDPLQTLGLTSRRKA